MLCTSRITPLLKNEELGVAGGIRPIAAGKLINRLALKAIMKKMVKREMMARTHFGVITTGGVEPVVRSFDQTVKKELEVEYRFMTSLDTKTPSTRSIAK